MSTRAGVLITGTEVLSGIIADRNGPWLSERLREIGVDAAHIVIVGDRSEDMLAALRFMAAERLDLVVTSGGLGPTADDLTAEIVGRFCGREMVLDPALEERIAEILAPMLARWPGLDPETIRHSNRKQAVIPAGATVLDPVGTAPGLIVTAAQGDGPTVVVLPGPPRELKPMWEMAVRTEAFRAATAGATTYRTRILRLFGIPESAIADTLRAASDAAVDLDAPRSRSRLATSRPRSLSTTHSWTSSAGVTRTPCSPRTGRRSTSRSPHCCAGAPSPWQSRAPAG